MKKLVHPALPAFLASFRQEIIWGEVRVQRLEQQFELRHYQDANMPQSNLRPVGLEELRVFSTENQSGLFRPLKSSPDLKRGWYTVLSSPEDLYGALHYLYPNSLPDWFAAGAPNPPLTHYREFTARQSGMYRITTMLTDPQAARVTAAACAASFCLKRRLWTVPGLDPDSTETKSAIPCLEPCAILLELARKAMRIEQEKKIHLEVSPSDLESLLRAAEVGLQTLSKQSPAGEISSPLNPRRIQLVLEKYREKLQGGQSAENQEP